MRKRRLVPTELINKKTRHISVPTSPCLTSLIAPIIFLDLKCSPQAHILLEPDSFIVSLSPLLPHLPSLSVLLFFFHLYSPLPLSLPLFWLPQSEQIIPALWFSHNFLPGHRHRSQTIIMDSSETSEIKNQNKPPYKLISKFWQSEKQTNTDPHHSPLNLNHSRGPILRPFRSALLYLCCGFLLNSTLAHCSPSVETELNYATLPDFFQVLPFTAYLEDSLSFFRCTGNINSSKKLFITLLSSRGNWHLTSVTAWAPTHQHHPGRNLSSSGPGAANLNTVCLHVLGQGSVCSDCSTHTAQQISEWTAAQNSQPGPLKLQWSPQARHQHCGGRTIKIFLFTLIPSVVFFHPLPPLLNFQHGNLRVNISVWEGKGNHNLKGGSPEMLSLKTA